MASCSAKGKGTQASFKSKKGKGPAKGFTVPEVGVNLNEDYDQEDDGPVPPQTWTDGLVDLLCSPHIPVLKEYNSFGKAQKEKHWDTIKQKFEGRGSTFTKDQIQSKFGKLKSAYTIVRDNNGKTGRKRKQFKHYEVMDAYFKDTRSAAVEITGTESGTGDGDSSAVVRRVRSAREDGQNKSNNKLLGELVAIEKRKADALQRLVNHLCGE